MKKMFSTQLNSNAINFWLLIFRICIGAIMLTHGLPKLNNLMTGNIEFLDPFGLGPGPSLTLTVFAEVVCTILVMIGLATRFATLPLIINMAVAILVAHAQDPFARKELALLYLVIFVGFLIMGAGKFSIDYFIGGRNKNRRY